MGLLSWFKRKDPRANHDFTDEDRQESVRMRVLNSKLKELKYQQKIREMEQVIADIEDDLYDDEDEGSNPLDEQLTKTFMQAITQKLGGELPSNSNPTSPPQLDLNKVQEKFMEWAKDNDIPEEKLWDLKRRIQE